nr:MAG TPA: major capsid protein [Bacteriophage sp.]
MGVNTTITVLGNLINPEVMTDMISATLPKKIKFSRIAGVDTTLEGREGDTVTIPKYAYIGDAEDVAEGVALGTVSLTATTTKVTVKKAGKATEISDEAILSAHGDTVGESVNQLAMAVASKIDDDCVKALNTATLKYDGSAGAISYEGIVKAIDLLEDESDTPVSKVIFVHPKQVTQLRLDADFRDLNKYPMPVIMTGAIGSIAGAQVIVSKRVTTDGDGNYVNPIVVVDTADPNEATTADKFATSSPALTIYLKRAVNVETDRDILKSTNVIKTDEHYVVVLTNDSKVVLATFKA